MMAEGEPVVPLSRIQNVMADDSGLPASVLRMTQKPGEVIISLLRGPGSPIHNFSPCKTSREVFPRVSDGRLEILWRSTGARTKS